MPAAPCYSVPGDEPAGEVESAPCSEGGADRVGVLLWGPCLAGLPPEMRGCPRVLRPLSHARPVAFPS